MKKIILTALMLVLVPAAALSADQLRFAGPAEPAAVAPEGWSQQDPADSLYRAARDAMNQGDYGQAATLFRQIWNQHPRSTYAPDAPYWEAFTRYRTNETDDLEQALASLELQKERYAKAPTRESGDAQALETRIRGILARRGDESSARAVVIAANQMAGLDEQMARVRAEIEAKGYELEAHREEIAQAVREATQGARTIVAGIGRSGAGDVPQECREQVETQLAALNALLQMSSERAMPVLKQVMERRDECSTPLRRRAVFLLADRNSPEAVDLLLQAARTDPDLDVQRQAVFWLSEVNDDRAVDALQQFVRSAKDEKIRERAVFALSQHPSPRAHAFLREVAEDATMPVGVRGRAVFWLAEEGTREDRAYLRQLFGRLDQPELKERILTGLGQSHDAETARWLLSIGADPKVAPSVRKKAIFWAGEAGAPASDLAALYDRLQDRDMKERVLFTLSQSSEKAALDKLIEIARTEKDPQLRKKAIFWLGNSNDPRAADVLMELLSNPPKQ